ncbi:MFS transporter [Propionimicrobium sp. PCR01-08-3]|uniref:MFS transporter n=1 Tax=Propionimicrobium sp. PCR01-08-3 TaxID=3052086 RepID=UPI00255C8FC1|nr:MFS transporter [Propionimicrobium sp. PCR01-08-3]WIY83328.1 MFS transporter [Propionimicrobium sp. PCR01-08-3]
MSQPTPEEIGSPPLVFTIAIIGGTLCVAFEAYGTLTAMPDAAGDLGRLDLYAWAFTAFVISQVLAIVLAGRLVDRIGPVLPLAVGMAIFGGGLLGAGMSVNMPMLLGFRALQGFGGGALNLAMMVVVAQAYGKSQRAWMMSVLSFCWMLPSFVGPPVSAWITTTWSWHWAFLVIVPLLVIVAAMGWRPLTRLPQLRHEPVKATNPVPVWAALLAACGTALIQFAGQQLDAVALGLGAVGLMILVVALPRLMTPGFMRFAGGLSSAMWTRTLAAGAYFAGESFIPVVLTQLYGFSLRGAGFFLALGATGWTLGSFVQAWSGLKMRRDQIVQLGGLCLVIATVMMTVAAWLVLPWWLFAVGFVMLGLGMGFVVSSTSLINMQLSEPRLIGRNTSSLQVGEGLGNALVTGLAGTIFAALFEKVSPAATFGPLYALCLIASILTLMVALRIGPVRNESSGVG